MDGVRRALDVRTIGLEDARLIARDKSEWRAIVKNVR